MSGLTRPGTFDAHRLKHLAGQRGVQDAVKERFLRATFSEGQPIGDPETLVRLATEAGPLQVVAAGAAGGDGDACAV